MIVDPLLEKLVVFSILMENHGGILNKAPKYVLEKYEQCMGAVNPVGLLDLTDRAKFYFWRDKWMRKEV